ncbi:phage portal protein [Arthrobacter sp. JSM 101049]|uniref:phage portal protein n=1 Tax=Arthrobacter sp. JSM 101049 TaxID=929097 RepID=UPI003561D5C5
MDVTLARERLELGLYELNSQAKAWDRRQNYLEGEQDLPYAPEGVNEEYAALQEMSTANWLDIAAGAPVQRLQVDGFKTGRDDTADSTVWNEVWQPNRLDSRQGIVFLQMYVHGRGMMSVSANPRKRKTPKIRPENARNVWLQPDPEDPFTHEYAVKVIQVRERADSQLILPDYLAYSSTKKFGYVYDDNEWMRFVSVGGSGAWTYDTQGRHGFNMLPYVPFDYKVDANGRPRSAIEGLFPQQDAINTIRFNTLLAMQFSAFRQRVFTGFDPVVRDKSGNPVLRMDDNGKPVLAKNGQPVPVLNSPGRVGVDRALVFPGTETKVFDLPESNLDNYIKVLQEFLTDFFATGQIPPQYMLSRMANLSGDALAGAESTLQSLVKDLKRAAGESLEEVMRLSNRARGESHEDNASEVIWADTEPRSFAQIVDAIGKLIGGGMARKDAWMMLPGATPPAVKQWVKNADDELAAQDAALNDTVRELEAV